MTVSKKYIAILAIALAVSLAPVFTQSAFAGPADTKARAFQDGSQITDSNPGQVSTDTKCVGSIDNDEGATKMVCYLVPPGVSNNDNSNAIAIEESTTVISCPSEGGFHADDQCYSVTFAGALFDQVGDWHFHTEFRDAQNNVIADARKTFQNHSFFVLPESPIGVAALVVSSLAVLGGFMFLRSRSHANLPI